jgi:hypothetical protein
MATSTQHVSSNWGNFTQMHLDLHDFVGEWKVSQKLWTAPNTQPVINHGITKCSTLLNGLATIMATEMYTSNFKGVALITHNPKQSRYELAWLDTISDQGILLMEGQQSHGPCHASILAEFGKTATQVREWTTVVAMATACLPRAALQSASRFATVGTGPDAAMAAPSVEQVPLSLIENKISQHQWVLEFYIPAPDGSQFLIQQNTFTRIGH